MLVVSRQRDEEVVITVPPSTEPTEIVVMVVDIRRTDKVRFGVTAPRRATIDRREIHEAKKRDARAIVAEAKAQLEQVRQQVKA